MLHYVPEEVELPTEEVVECQNYCDAVLGSVNLFENKLVREFQ